MEDRSGVGAIGEQFCKKRTLTEQRSQQPDATVAILNTSGMDCGQVSLHRCRPKRRRFLGRPRADAGLPHESFVLLLLGTFIRRQAGCSAKSPLIFPLPAAPSFLAHQTVGPSPSSAALRLGGECGVDRFRPVDRHRGRDGRGLETKIRGALTWQTSALSRRSMRS